MIHDMRLALCAVRVELENIHLSFTFYDCVIRNLEYNPMK